MKNLYALVGIMLISAASYSQTTINDANAEKRSVPPYHGVAISGNIELFLTQGNEESVVVSADDVKTRARIITEVKDGVLRIFLENKARISIDWTLNSKRPRAYVSVKDLDYLSSSGSGKVHVEGVLRAEKLDADISGSGNMEATLAVKELSLGLSGSANADLAGNADRADFHISGSGNIRSYELSTGYCKASISGSGNVRVTVTKELSAHISGSGNVSVKGDGLVRDYTASGSGKFRRVK